MENCPKLDPSLIIPSSDEIDQRCQELRESRDNAEAEVNSVNEQIDNLADQVSRTKNATIGDRLEAKMVELDASLKALTERLASITAELGSAESSLRNVDRWQAELVTLCNKIAEESEEAPMFRQKLNGHLRDLVSHVETFSHGYTKLMAEEPKQKLQTSQSKKSGKKRVGLVKDNTPPQADDILLYVDQCLKRQA